MVFVPAGSFPEGRLAVQVRTPDRALDLMLNQWLLYQTLGCRFWARTAFYQSSGAYGFRDQLQDVMALAVSRPDLTRAHIIKSAAHQFVEGDVQHWWHEPCDRGIRTRFSDDLLWLPYAISGYLDVTADRAILDEIVPFMEGAVLAPGQLTSYFEPRVADEHATLFEHCARAIDRSLAVGTHGLPLMGTGDWNDGMNRVGDQGRGESVWLAWFLATVVVILAQQIASGNAAKYFNAVLGVTISTTLISYLLIYPALWKLRRSHPATPRPFRMPWYRPLTAPLREAGIPEPGEGKQAWYLDRGGKTYRPLTATARRRLSGKVA